MRGRPQWGGVGGAVLEMQPTAKTKQNRRPDVWEGKRKSSRIGSEGGRGSEHARFGSHDANNNERALLHTCIGKPPKALRSMRMMVVKIPLAAV